MGRVFKSIVDVKVAGITYFFDNGQTQAERGIGGATFLKAMEKFGGFDPGWQARIADYQFLRTQMNLDPSPIDIMTNGIFHQIPHQNMSQIGFDEKLDLWRNLAHKLQSF